MKKLALISLILLLGCDDKAYRLDNSSYLMLNDNKSVSSTSSGNLVATAIKEVHNLDMVFYPSDFLQEDGIALLKGSTSLNSVLSMYPGEGAYDQFAIGTMSGEAIKNFIRSRVSISYSADLQVAGIEYSASFTGGIGHVGFTRKHAADLDDDQYYKVAISNFFYFSGATFPSYQYGDNLDYDFKFAATPLISAREAVTQFVEDHPDGFPELSEVRARVVNNIVGDAGYLPTYKIQGDSHRSKYIGQTVSTKGVITAIGTRAWYPGGIDIFIQDLEGDGNDMTSDGVHVYLFQDDTQMKLGDTVEVSGVVYEQMTGSGLGRTSIREVSHIDTTVSSDSKLNKLVARLLNDDSLNNKLIASLGISKGNSSLDETIVDMVIALVVKRYQNEDEASLVEAIVAKLGVTDESADVVAVAADSKRSEYLDTLYQGVTSAIKGQNRDILIEEFLPTPIFLGEGGRVIPDKILSTYNGDLNFKKGLTLTDGIDFYESLEGMRVKITNSRLVGFRGGKEDMTDSGKAKGYLTLYVLPEGLGRGGEETSVGGLVSFPEIDDHNPEIVMITTNHLTAGINTSTIFNVGDSLEGDLVGVMSYEKNIFGDGEYTMVLPQDQDLSSKLKSGKEGRAAGTMVKVADRPKTSLIATDDQLTVATFNVENLAGYQWDRLANIGEAIAKNLHCPDIVNLVEIQDLNGEVFKGSSSADETLRRLLTYIDCDGVYYKAVNIDPVDHAEGGEPGGNIRVAHIYNANKLSFTVRGSDDPLAKAMVLKDGSLNNNPGRVFPMDPSFAKTRKSLVAEYVFKKTGERIFVIGNHLKSKLGDSSAWGNDHPIIYASDSKRVKMTAKIKEFVDMIYYRNPTANVIVTGDFNAYPHEYSMKVLEAAGLSNMVFMLPVTERYTHNYNGSSNAIDHIFAGPNLMKRNPEFEIVHINTDYMGRLSDHDPVLALFEF